MKSVIFMSASVRTACQQASVCFPLYRGLSLCNSSERLTDAEFVSKTVIAEQPGMTDPRCFQRERTRTASAGVALLYEVPATATRRNEATRCHTDGHLAHRPVERAAQHLSSYTPYAKVQRGAAAHVNIQSLFEEDVITELCSKLADLPINDRAEGLATLLQACVEFGLEAQSPPVLILLKECLELLPSRDVGVAQLCQLGKVACALEGRGSSLVAEVMNSISCAVEDMVSPSEAAAVYSLLTVLYEPSCQQQALMLSVLHRQTQRQINRLKSSQVSDILQCLLKLNQKQTISLVLRLSHRASRVFKAFSDDEIIKVLSALITLGQHDEELLAAMEKHLPERLGTCDPELISKVMEYCLHMRCRSEPIFEAVAENFVCSAERHTDTQIAKQVVAIGRLNYLPQCSSQMFKKLENVLTTRFSHFQPRSLLDMLHACIHLERFPLNYMNKIFSPYFLQKLQDKGEPVDKNALRQLTQLHLSASLECTYYWGPRLPFSLHVKKFSSLDQAFESPMETLLYRQVKGPLMQLLGGKYFFARVFTPIGYTVDVEICLDENGFILPQSQWESTNKRIALCLDGQSRFCANTRHLLGKEATKRRHLYRMGYEVVEIPYFEFENQKTQEEQVQYLHDKIFPAVSKFRLSHHTS
ncbi:FAST kinase domain-containing protein 3, mitochondrial-like isoform X1 [Gambusia affinis]|uniref:FAST kinase domain-containing protein 3, mitochondrial-like isoform X1 n=1 Tax=Gambusia affinis TaxID=33528 RepID=UPI001CDD65F4|nr:FAST kinase domain-containing protein 3, mitochondrial-like isoform X1 [Gambusia affinis]